MKNNDGKCRPVNEALDSLNASLHNGTMDNEPAHNELSEEQDGSEEIIYFDVEKSSAEHLITPPLPTHILRRIALWKTASQILDLLQWPLLLVIYILLLFNKPRTAVLVLYPYLGMGTRVFIACGFVWELFVFLSAVFTMFSATRYLASAMLQFITFYYGLTVRELSAIYVAMHMSHLLLLLGVFSAGWGTMLLQAGGLLAEENRGKLLMFILSAASYYIALFSCQWILALKVSEGSDRELSLKHKIIGIGGAWCLVAIDVFCFAYGYFNHVRVNLVTR